jgi:Tol biopolymer transport system component
MGQEPVKGDPKHYEVPEVDEFRGSVSPDGRFLSFVDWSTGDLAVRDLKTGEDRRLTNKGSWLESEEYAVFSIISPDSKQVAYLWFNEDCSYDLDYSYDLRVIGLDGSGPRVLYPKKEIGESWPYDWSPDGKYILATLMKKDKPNQIGLVSVADGSVRVLKTLDWRSPWEMKFSPDGHYIAYDFPPQKDSPERDLFLLSSDGRREIPLVQDPADDLLLGWAPDGKRVLFASDRTGTWGVWVIEVGDGKPHGSPELVKPGIGPIARSLGLTRDGSYYYGLRAWVNDIYLATFDPGTGKLQPPKKLVTHVGFNTSVQWSPDGQQLAYASGSGWGLGGDPTDPLVLRIRSVETGKERRFRLKMSRLGYRAFQPHWSLDGQSLLATGGTNRGGLQDPQGLYRIDAQTGKATPIVQVIPVVQIHACCIGWPVWAHDGKVIFARWFAATSGSRRIVARDLKTGREKELYRSVPTATVSHLAVSPDGQRLAFIWGDTKEEKTLLKVMPTGGGEPHELFGVQAPEVIFELGWTPDGRHILFGTGTTGQEQRFALWRISTDGGEPQELGLSMEGLRLYGLSVHPDGRRIAFTAGTPVREEVWVLENFLPALKAAK